MERSVLSWKMALAKSYDPGVYTYNVNQIPLGEFDAILDFKIWSKRILAINCYFTKIDTQSQFVVTIYCNNRTGNYEVAGSAINFALCGTGTVYGINVTKNLKGKITLVEAKPTTLVEVTK